MRLGISAFINQEDNNFLKEYSGCNLQIGFYKKSFLDFARDNHLKSKLKEWKINVISAHLPVDLDFRNLDEIYRYINIAHLELIDVENSGPFTLHPKYKVTLNYRKLNCFLELMASIFAYNSNLFSIAIETFPYKRKKNPRSPLDIVEICTKYERFWMTLDLAHLQYHNLWLDERILPHLLRYTEVIHLSNRSRNKTHTPIREGEIDIEKFLNNLKTNNWNGNIFLEYGINYKNKLLEDLKWVKSFLESREKQITEAL